MKNLSRFYGRTGCQIFVDRFWSSKTKEQMDGRILREWNDSSVIWKPFPDGMYRNIDFYGGDLQGIIEKLDYMEELGINLIYLSPISKTVSNHHYDVQDQRVIDPYIGTASDFEEMCKKAHARNILIIVDLVFNHVGIESEFFKKAMNGDPFYKEWFFIDESGNYKFWNVFRDMPLCNQLNKSYQEYAKSVVEFYIQLGADGFRLDLGETLEGSFVDVIREHAEKLNPEIMIVNERWNFAMSDEGKYWDVADSVMNYPQCDATLRWIRYGNYLHFDYTMGRIDKYPSSVKCLLWNMLDSQDTPRALTMLGAEGMTEDPIHGDSLWKLETPWENNGRFDTFAFREWEFMHENSHEQQDIERLILSSIIQYMLVGIPVTFYGTEVGVRGYKDPFNRKNYPWNDRNQMLFEHYKKLGEIRKKYRKVFSTANEKRTGTSNFMKIERWSDGGERIVAFINRSDTPMPIDITVFGNILYSFGQYDQNNVHGNSAIICKVK